MHNDGSCKWELKKITNAEQLNGLSINELTQNIRSGIEIFWGTIAPNIDLGTEGVGLGVAHKMGIQFSPPEGYTKEQCKILAFGSYSIREYTGDSWSKYHDVIVSTPQFYTVDSNLRTGVVYKYGFPSSSPDPSFKVNYIIFAKK